MLLSTEIEFCTEFFFWFEFDECGDEDEDADEVDECECVGLMTERTSGEGAVLKNTTISRDAAFSAAAKISSVAAFDDILLFMHKRESNFETSKKKFISWE